MRQFETLEEIDKALQPGVVFYKFYGGEKQLEPLRVVSRDKDFASNSFKAVTFKYVNGGYFTTECYIEDMQNWYTKATFTDEKMAEAFRRANPVFMEGRRFQWHLL
jgi:hypothetical protein